MSGIKLSTNASVVIIVVMAIACAGFLVWSDSPLSSTVIPLLLPFAGGAIVSVLKQRDTDVKVAAISGQVDANTTLTEQAVENVDIIHKSVNSELAKWKQSVIDQAKQDQALWEERSKSLIAAALAEGLRLGRLEMETSHRGTVTEAARVASVAAETATEAARVVVDAAAAAAARLKDAQPISTPAGDAVVVEVDALPATIHVTTPEDTPT